MTELKSICRKDFEEWHSDSFGYEFHPSSPASEARWHGWKAAWDLQQKQLKNTLKK